MYIFLLYLSSVYTVEAAKQVITENIAKTPTLFIRRKDAFESVAVSEFIQIAKRRFDFMDTNRATSYRGGSPHREGGSISRRLSPQHPISFQSANETNFNTVISSVEYFTPSLPTPLFFTPPCGILSTRNEGMSLMMKPSTSNLSAASARKNRQLNQNDRPDGDQIFHIFSRVIEFFDVVNNSRQKIKKTSWINSQNGQFVYYAVSSTTCFSSNRLNADLLSLDFLFNSID